jgi:hypothetical protein
MSLLLAAIFVAVFCFWFWKRTRKPEAFPPGPPRWPVIGSLPHISGKHNNLLLGLLVPIL